VQVLQILEGSIAASDISVNWGTCREDGIQVGAPLHVAPL